MPSSAMRARMPPSPSLSMLIAKITYFTDVLMISVHRISERTPRTMSGFGAPPVRSRTVLSVSKRARPDVAKDDSERRQAHRRQTRTADGGSGIRLRAFGYDLLHLAKSCNFRNAFRTSL